MAIANIRAVVLDCPDPRGLAEFYRALVGGDIVQNEPSWVRLRDGKHVALAFQRVDDYRPPQWPSAERPQQLHIDVTVDDVDRAEREVLALGAAKHDVQPGDDGASGFRVFLDPAGHPFCLCWD